MKRLEGFVFKAMFVLIMCFNLLLVYKYTKISKYYEAEREANTTMRISNKELFFRDIELLSQDVDFMKTTIWKKFIPETTCLIFVYSGGECDKCILENLFMIKEKFGELLIRNVAVFPVFEDIRDIRIALNANLNGMRYYRLDPGTIRLPIYKGIPARFFALLSPDGKITLPFFPDTVESWRTEAYLDFVIEKYFKKSG